MPKNGMGERVAITLVPGVVGSRVSRWYWSCTPLVPVVLYEPSGRRWAVSRKRR
jgi:hypothetical protein